MSYSDHVIQTGLELEAIGTNRVLLRQTELNAQLTERLREMTENRDIWREAAERRNETIKDIDAKAGHDFTRLQAMTEVAVLEARANGKSDADVLREAKRIYIEIRRADPELDILLDRRLKAEEAWKSGLNMRSVKP